jgi:hypothetical protein
MISGSWKKIPFCIWCLWLVCFVFFMCVVREMLCCSCSLQGHHGFEDRDGARRWALSHCNNNDISTCRNSNIKKICKIPTCKIPTCKNVNMYNFNMSNNNNTNNNNRESKSKNDNNDNGKQQRLQQPASLRTQVDWAGEAVSLTCNLKAVCLLLLLLFCCCCFLFLVNRFVYFIFCWCDCLFFFQSL